MSNQKQSSFAAYIPKFIIGVVLMVGGLWVSKNWHPPFMEAVHELGLPIDLGKTVSTIGVLLIVFPLVNFFYLKPLNEAIVDRTQSLESTFTEAEQLRSDMTAMKADYEKRLAETETNAREKIQAQIKEAQDMRRTLMAEANAQAEEMKRQAIEEIAAEKQKALTELRINVANLSLLATEKILSENMDNERNRRLVDEFINSVEVRN